MSELFDKVKSGCGQFNNHQTINWDCHLCLELALAHLCDAINELNQKWEERLNGNIEEDRFTIVGDDGRPLESFVTSKNITPGPIVFGTPASGSNATPGGGNPTVVEREDSVGRRRRRQEFDGLGILHEEGGDQ